MGRVGWSVELGRLIECSRGSELQRWQRERWHFEQWHFERGKAHCERRKFGGAPSSGGVSRSSPAGGASSVGAVDGVSTDAGSTCSVHSLGGPADGRFVVGDMNVYGRVHTSTSDRGVIYGQPR